MTAFTENLSDLLCCSRVTNNWLITEAGCLMIRMLAKRESEGGCHECDRESEGLTEREISMWRAGAVSPDSIKTLTLIPPPPPP